MQLLYFLEFALLALCVSGNLVKDKRIQIEDLPPKIQKADPEDAYLTIPEIVTKYGYPIEVHQVISEGYILTVHRIPYGRKSGPAEGKPVVFLMHGALSSSADWIITGVESAFAYLLADEGYDVWLGNQRGNKLSRNHTSLNPDTDEAFWDFTWHEIGLYDVPNMIDYVLAQTGQSQLFYFGHSQGTSVFYVMCSEKPEYNNKIRAHFSLSPIAFMNHMTSFLLQYIAFFEDGLEFLFDLIGKWEFEPTDDFLAMYGSIYCSDSSPTQILCTNSLFIMCGFNPKQMNTTLLPIMMGHTPAGASTKQILHFSQLIRSGKFQQYDYGYWGNMDHYGTASPPDYDLSKITAPTYLFYSRNDWLSAEIDVLKLFDILPNCLGKFLNRDSLWNHLDYMYGIDARTNVYYPAISLMKNH